MPNTASVILMLQDVRGNPASDPQVMVRIRETHGSYRLETRLKVGARGVRFTGLPAFPQSKFMTCWVAPSRYRATRSQVFGLSAGEEHPITLRLVRKSGEWKPRFRRWADLPDSFDPLKAVLLASPDLRAHGGKRFASLTGGVYDTVSRNTTRLAKAALLNLFAKMSTLEAPAGRPWFLYVRRILEIRRDRFIALVDPEMEGVIRAIKSDIGAHPDYENTDAQNHHGNLPHADYRVWKTKMRSIKSSEAEGNLQLTLAPARERSTGRDVLLLDADIDEKGRLFEHLLEVFGHRVTGKKTHPFDVHEILMASDPGLETGYTLV